jgi:hypothetical protein
MLIMGTINGYQGYRVLEDFVQAIQRLFSTNLNGVDDR